MTVLNLEEKEGKWFEMEGGGKVELRSLSYDALKKIDKQVSVKRVDFKKVEGTPERFEYKETNEDLQNELFWDYCIISWENLFDSKEKEIPCTKDNKVLLMTKSVMFAKFISDSLQILTESETKQAEALEKN
jgi:hypothetical protein